MLLRKSGMFLENIVLKIFMQLQQLGQTIELLQQKLIAEQKKYDEAFANNEQLQSLKAKIKETKEQLQKYKQEYDEQFNKNIDHFDRHKASSN